jgi:DNA polymerase-3 subunit delta'
VGKRSAAVGLGMALNCETAPGPGTACGTCEPCRRIAAGIHPDVVTFAAEGALILMEQAQQIVALGQQRPHEARARVIIIDGAERMNANASNCLLKTLEEPLRGTVLVLVTAAPERLLPTIRSRTQRVRFHRVPERALLELGDRRALDAAKAAVAAVLADGSVERFLALSAPAEGEAGEDESPVRIAAALRTAIRGRGVAPLLDVAATFGDKESKQQLPDALALLGRAYRDALVTAAGASELALLGHQPDGDRDLTVPGSLSLHQLGRALEAISEAEEALAGNVNTTMALERMLLALRREERTAS